MTMPQNKEPFQWDDHLVKEYLRLVTSVEGDAYWQSELDKFKRSKQPKPKDWRILSFKRIKDWDEQTFEYNANGDYTDSRSGYAITLNSLLHKGSCVDSGHFVIQSVQRLSDGAVFTVGDLVTVEENSIVIPIDSFEYKNEEVLVNGKEVNNYCFFNYPVNRLQKANPVLFTTHDGVAIKAGDIYWYLVVTASREYHVFQNTAHPSDTMHKWHKTFSTEESAKAYIRDIQPIFSIQDIAQLWSLDKVQVNRLIDFANKKGH